MPGIIKNAFKDVERRSLPRRDGKIGGLDYLNRVATMQVGYGSEAMRMDQDGMWLGAPAFADAPFSVDMNGNLVASSATFGQYLSKAGANQVVTGQIIVGGSDNGIIYVKDSSSNVKVQLDEDGILINSGKMVIKNADETTTIDSKGVVSTANFNSSSVIGTGTQSTTNNAFQDVTGLTVNVTVSRTQNVLIFGGMVGLASAEPTDVDAPNCEGRLLVGAVEVSTDLLMPGRHYDTGAGYTVTADSAFTQEVLQLAEGTHTIKLQFRETGANGDTVYVWRDNCVVGYVALGN